MGHAPTPTTIATVAALLHAAARSPLDPREARILLAHALGWPRTALITRDQDRLEPAAVARYQALAQRRLAGEPVAQLLGTREFYGLEFSVTPSVLIPRPETELLVEQALQACVGMVAPALLDLGTGSGAIAIALAYSRPDASVTATDRSAQALGVAQRNANRLLPADRAGGALRLLAGDWFAALESKDGLQTEAALGSADTSDADEREAGVAGPTTAQAVVAQRFHVIVSNPPYIRADDPHLLQGDLRFEPRGALTDEADGLSAIRAIVAGAPAHLLADGALWIEHGYDQAQDVAALLHTRGFDAVESIADLAGIDRITGGRWRCAK
nr:HemK/PrmC family methyltransferase [Burkholderia sp. L27(2015)]